MFIKKYVAMLKNEFSGYNSKKFSKDLLAGLTVTAVALPLALAFGIQCGASAEAGLITAIIAGLVIGALSGASFQISGPTGAMSAVLIGVVASQLGLKGVFVVSLIAGILILICAILKLGRFVEKIPRPVITGFTSGIALIIAFGQVQNFFGLPSLAQKHENSFINIIYFIKEGFKLNLNALLISLIVVVIMMVWPKKLNAIIPSSLVGIIIATLVSLIPVFGGENMSVVGEIPKKIFLDDRFSFD